MDEVSVIQLFLQRVSILAIPVLFAITVHEAAHGWVAYRLGDSTAMMLGRVTFNPLKHIDPVGTVLVPLATLLMTGFLFGWAKPVPVDWRNLHNQRRDMGLVALAGPGANLIMALFWGILIKFGLALAPVSEWFAMPLIAMGAAGVFINCILMVLNLTPIPPLDGGRVLAALLPPKLALAFSRLEPYGLFIVLGLLVTGVLGRLLWPVVWALIDLLPGSQIVAQFFNR
ncbi:MAG TPA: site-2 protease family protein [Sedimenticola sp.]|nr:site-2 protease family protein [Sedimenticola sp.]